MRSKQAPQHRDNARPWRDCPEWLLRMDREQAEEAIEAARREHSIRVLEATARLLNLREPPVPLVNVILPEARDPLETMDPVPDTDIDFPVSSQEFWATWRIGVFHDEEELAGATHRVTESDGED